MYKVNVTVSSMPHMGKSTIAEFIADKLREIGCEVELTDDNGCGVVECAPDPIGARLDKLIKHGVGIEINTKRFLPGG